MKADAERMAEERAKELALQAQESQENPSEKSSEDSDSSDEPTKSE